MKNVSYWEPEDPDGEPWTIHIQVPPPRHYFTDDEPWEVGVDAEKIENPDYAVPAGGFAHPSLADHRRGRELKRERDDWRTSYEHSIRRSKEENARVGELERALRRKKEECDYLLAALEEPVND